MSTKSTIAYGKNFHFYQEALDDDFVYLQLEAVQFEAQYNQIMVPIPVHIWEVIRKYEVVDLSWSSKTDQEILEYVEQQVNNRIERYEQEKESKTKNLISLLGSMPFGLANTSRSEQIERGITYYKKMREHQQQIKQAIDELENKNKSK